MPYQNVIVDDAYIDSIVNFSLDELKNDRGKLLDAISLRGAYLVPRAIQNMFNLTDEEFAAADIQLAIQTGKDMIAELMGRKKLDIALKENNLKAIDYFMNISGSTLQPERQYQFNYNQKGEEDWETLKKNSDFN